MWVHTPYPVSSRKWANFMMGSDKLIIAGRYLELLIKIAILDPLQAVSKLPDPITELASYGRRGDTFLPVCGKLVFTNYYGLKTG